jgi:hypothetical protein
VPAQKKEGPAQKKWGQEPPDVEWLVPELDDGVDDPLLRPELEELELDEPELELEDPDEPEVVPDEPELILVEPELCVPDDEPVDFDDPDEAGLCEEDVPLV